MGAFTVRQAADRLTASTRGAKWTPDELAEAGSSPEEPPPATPCAKCQGRGFLLKCANPECQSTGFCLGPLAEGGEGDHTPDAPCPDCGGLGWLVPSTTD